MSQPPECWDYRCVPPYPASLFFLSYFTDLSIINPIFILIIFCSSGDRIQGLVYTRPLSYTTTPLSISFTTHTGTYAN
jgi:hypothetical protein